MPKITNHLTAAQAERLALLLEELGEAQQAIGKILRHGYESTNPTIQDGPTNRQTLEYELGDVKAAMTLLANERDVSIAEIDRNSEYKLLRVGKYFHHQKERK